MQTEKDLKVFMRIRKMQQLINNNYFSFLCYYCKRQITIYQWDQFEIQLIFFCLYEVKIVEVFKSFSNWTAGTTIKKTINVTNDKIIDMVLHTLYTEKLINAKSK